MVLDGAAFDEVHGHEMVTIIQKFIEPKLEKAVAVPFRVIVIDNADRISHSNQTSLKKVFDTNLMKLKWIMTASNVKNLIGSIQTKGLLLTTKPASEKDTLLILLYILQRNRVGFERAGLRRLFELHSPGLSLSAMLGVLQRCFVRFQFVSEENVTKAFGAPARKAVVSPLALLGETLARCKTCTLVPPCKHHPIDALLARAAAIRARLPARAVGSTAAGPGQGGAGMVCPSYARAGVCEISLKHGCCMLAHPPSMHIVSQARRVCPQCTVAWPCNHCKYSVERRKLGKLLEATRRRLNLLVEINQPDPPAYLIRKIVDTYDDWREIVAGLAAFYLTKAKEAVLADTAEWLDTGFSADVKEYLRRQAALGQAFGEVLRSPLLIEPTFSRQNSRGGGGGGGGGGVGGGLVGDDEESSVLSSLGSLGSLSLASAGGRSRGSPPPSKGRG